MSILQNPQVEAEVQKLIGDVLQGVEAIANAALATVPLAGPVLEPAAFDIEAKINAAVEKAVGKLLGEGTTAAPAAPAPVALAAQPGATEVPFPLKTETLAGRIEAFLHGKPSAPVGFKVPVGQDPRVARRGMVR